LSALVRGMEALTEKYNDLMKLGDPRTRDWFLMASPIPSTLICLLYVLAIIVGMRAMQNRQAMGLRYPMIVYNFCMVALSGYLVFEFLASGWLAGYSLGCQPVDYSNSPQATRMARACYLFYFSKFIELADTVFFVLRKKFNQVSFLHVFHHAIMPASWWFGVYFVPGGFGTFHAMLNSFIHFLMYMYYGLAAAGYTVWWKRYMTKMQIGQFLLVTVHSCQLFFIPCNYPIVFAWWILSYAVIFLILFANFYVKAYAAGRRLQQQQQKQNGHQNGAHSKERLAHAVSNGNGKKAE
ncbi:hypothetical protein BOX15_Mlig002892g1, partial [Macrostomum lignano]